MGKFLRLAAGVTCLGVLVLEVVLLDPACPLRFPHWGDSTVRRSLAEEIERAEQMDQGLEALRRRREAKWHTAEEVMAGRLSLADAMERFHALDREWPPGHVRMPEHFGMSEDEWDGRGVLFYVLLVLQSRHDGGDPILDRLEKELQELLVDRKTRSAAPAEARSEPSR